MNLPPYVSRELILDRLPFIFKEGTEHRQYVIREMAASTVFAMIYFGAIEGNDTYISPLHVYRMTYEQAAQSKDQERLDCLAASRKKSFQPTGKRWYADNSREPIRDETLREGLVRIGAVGELQGVSTTSSSPRYFLKKDFAALFNPALKGDALESRIKEWQEQNLSKGAIARLRLAAHAMNSSEESVIIQLPNGESRKISGGPSSNLSKTVIESFAPRFLKRPALLWLSLSDDKIRDDRLAREIGLNIEADKNLPDLILIDLEPTEPILIFTEIVATDGAITARRQEALYQISDAAGFKRAQIAFLTAYADRHAVGFLKTVKDLAWNSFMWFASEPDHIVYWNNQSITIADHLIFKSQGV